MNEFSEIIQSTVNARQRGVESVLATVVRVRGSTYRRPGARMLMTLDGERIGAISGGCLEKEVGKKAWWLTESRVPVVVKYDTSADDDVVFEFGLGCQGIVWVLLERLSATATGSAGEIDAAAALEFARRAIARGERCAVATTIAARGAGAPAVGTRVLFDVHGDRPNDAAFAPHRDDARNGDLRAVLHGAAINALQTRTSCTRNFALPAGGTIDAFIEVVQPPLPLIICGAGHDAPPVAHAAKRLGWHVTVVDPRAAYATPARFPDADDVIVCKPAELGQRVRLDDMTAAVLMTHNFADDVAMLRQLAASPARYIGALGPRSRGDALLHELEKTGAPLTDALRQRIHSPIGLDIGAETPAEIAAAIVGEIQSCVGGRRGGPLRDQAGPIHPPAADDALLLDETPSAGAASCPISTRPS